MIVLQLEKLFPEYQKIDNLPGQHNTYSKVSKPENAIPEISNTKSFHESNAPIWKFRKLNIRFLSISKLKTGGAALPIFERFAAWIHDSWASANQTHSRAALPICGHFQASIHDSWVSAIQSPFMTAEPIIGCFATWIHDCCASKYQPPFGTALHINELLGAWKHDSWASANQADCWTPLPIFQRFAA